MLNYAKSRPKINKKVVLIVALALAVAFIVLFLLERKGVTNLYTRNTSSNSGAPNSDVGKVNYGPPTEDERKSGDERKKEIVKEEERQSQNPADTAQVIITNAQQYNDVIEVNSFINNVYEEGVCTFRFELGTSVVTKETAAYKDVSTTICPNPLFPRTQFPSPGDWKATIMYKSNSGITGQATQTVNIK